MPNPTLQDGIFVVVNSNDRQIYAGGIPLLPDPERARLLLAAIVGEALHAWECFAKDAEIARLRAALAACEKGDSS